MAGWLAAAGWRRRPPGGLRWLAAGWLAAGGRLAGWRLAGWRALAGGCDWAVGWPRLPVQEDAWLQKPAAGSVAAAQGGRIISNLI